MSAFLQALERTARTEQQFGRERQQRLVDAELKAFGFFNGLSGDLNRLSELGVAPSLKGRTVSFKKGSLEVLAITFGTFDGNEIRISSPVVEYLKLNPSAEDISIESDVDEAAGRWLARSIDVVERNRPVFADLGYA